jgi:hypothetical protein
MGTVSSVVFNRALKDIGIFNCMKNLYPLAVAFLVLLVACQQKETSTSSIADVQDPVDLLKELPSSWTMLTEHEGKQVIYQPCDANNTVVEIRNDTLYINWGQEEGFYNITTVKKDEHDNLILSGKSAYEATEERFMITVLDDQKKQARWYVWLNDSASSVFTDSRLADTFETIKQPCRECWGEDVCDQAALADTLNAD